MLLVEVMSSQSVVDWFVSAMVPLFSTAYNRAESTYNDSENTKAARMQAGMVLGKWYSENVITRGSYSLNDLVNLLKPHDVKIPDIITDRKQKEEMQYSSSGNLQQLITDLVPVLQRKGYGPQSKILANALDTFRKKMTALFAGPVEEPVRARPDPVVGNQRDQANQLVQDIISRLPRDVQHDVRTAVARRGNTLAALSAELEARGIRM